MSVERYYGMRRLLLLKLASGIVGGGAWLALFFALLGGNWWLVAVAVPLAVAAMPIIRREKDVETVRYLARSPRRVDLMVAVGVLASRKALEGS